MHRLCASSYADAFSTGLFNDCVSRGEIGIVLGQEGRSGKMEMHCVPIDVLDGSLRDHVSPDPYTMFAHGFDLAEAQAVNAIDRHPRLDPNWLK